MKLFILCGALILFRCGATHNNQNAETTNENTDNTDGSESFTPKGYGGTTIGNGGSIIICKKRHASLGNRSMLLVDIYEAWNILGLKLQFHHDSADQIIRNVLEEFGKIDPDRATQYKNQYDKFWSNTTLANRLYLPDVPDTGVIQMPEEDCSVQKISYQDRDEKGDVHYYIKKEFWDLIDELNRAALILHEIIYSEAAALNHQIAKSTRNLNSYILSGDLSKYTTKDYARLIAHLRFPAIKTVKRWPLQMSDLIESAGRNTIEGELDISRQNLIDLGTYLIRFEDDGRRKRIYFKSDDMDLLVGTTKVQIINPDQCGLMITAPSVLKFSTNYLLSQITTDGPRRNYLGSITQKCFGQPQSMTKLSEATFIYFPKMLSVAGLVSDIDCSLKFSSRGFVSEICLYNTFDHVLEVQGLNRRFEIKPKENAKISFDHDGWAIDVRLFEL